MKAAALYESVTARIIRDLEAGTPTWIRPWKTGRTIGIMPANAITGRAYSGINVPVLWIEADVHGYEQNAWLTFKQALDAGGHVKKGEKGTTVFFTKQLTVKDEDDEERKVSMLRQFVVFNISQVEGVSAAHAVSEPPPEGAVSAFLKATGADIRHGGNRACYVSTHDFIAMPNPSDFESLAHYDATRLHEACHWTGHKTRLDRDLRNRFGTRAYAAEELVAELGAAFLCGHLGVKGELRHASYLDSWRGLLKDDTRAIFTAAAKAQQAADYLRGFNEKVEEAA